MAPELSGAYVTKTIRESRTFPECSSYHSRTNTEVQATRPWRPPTGTLGKLLEQARLRAEQLERRRADLKALAADTPAGGPFADVLRRADVAVIAEVKRASPSKGLINPGVGAVALAGAFADGGASALSVLTEPDHFMGSVQDLVDIRRRVQLPILKKDFHIDSVQVLEARAIGASAILLIARALEPSRLGDLAGEAAQLGLEVLIEVRDEDELARAVALGASAAPMIGVNNRNLETLVVNHTTAERILPLVPADRIAIHESGIAERSQVETAAERGADAVLVGSSISAATEPTMAVRALTGVARRGRTP